MWLIKDKNSQILGPFSDEEICQQISSFRLNGDELIAKNSLGPWKPLSSHPPFYEVLLKVLSKDSNTDTPHSTISLEDPKIPLSNTNEQVIKSSTTKTSSKKRSFSKRQRVSNDKHISDEPPVNQVKIRKKSKDSSIIEMADVRSEVSKSFIRKSFVPFFIGFLFLGFLFILFSKEDNSSADHLQLIIPRENQPSLPPEEIVAKIKMGMNFFLKDEVISYLKSSK